jgi:integrating conjugative element protein (TIGR03765 family)
VRASILAGLLAGWATATAAPPVVIHDAGGTEPIAPYMAPHMEPVPPVLGADAVPWPESALPPAGVFDLRSRLPVISPGLQPGRLIRDASRKVRERLRSLPRPLCLVGSDPRSLQWLDTHGATLRAIGAACLAVEVPDEVAWEQLVVAGNGLPMIPVPGTDLAETLGLTVYPVLITQDGFEQ